MKGTRINRLFHTLGVKIFNGGSFPKNSFVCYWFDLYETYRLYVKFDLNQLLFLIFFRFS